MLSCVVVSCRVVSCLVLSCPRLSCPVLSCVVFVSCLFCLVLSCLVLVSVVLSYLRCAVLCGVVFVVLGRFVDCSSIALGLLGVEFGHFGWSWGPLGAILG